MNIVGFQRKPADTKSCISVAPVASRDQDRRFAFHLLWPVVSKSNETARIIGLVTIYPYILYKRNS